MTIDWKDARYRLVRTIVRGTVSTYEGKSIQGETVFLHFLGDRTPAEMEALRSNIRKLGDRYLSQVIEYIDSEGGMVLVTRPIANFTSLLNWLKPPQTPKTPPARVEPIKPRPPEPKGQPLDRPRERPKAPAPQPDHGAFTSAFQPAIKDRGRAEKPAVEFERPVPTKTPRDENVPPAKTSGSFTDVFDPTPLKKAIGNRGPADATIDRNADRGPVKPGGSFSDVFDPAPVEPIKPDSVPSPLQNENKHRGEDEIRSQSDSPEPMALGRDPGPGSHPDASPNALSDSGREPESEADKDDIDFWQNLDPNQVDPPGAVEEITPPSPHSKHAFEWRRDKRRPSGSQKPVIRDRRDYSNQYDNPSVSPAPSTAPEPQLAPLRPPPAFEPPQPPPPAPPARMEPLREPQSDEIESVEWPSELPMKAKPRSDWHAKISSDPMGAHSRHPSEPPPRIDEPPVAPVKPPIASQPYQPAEPPLQDNPVDTWSMPPEDHGAEASVVDKLGIWFWIGGGAALAFVVLLIVALLL